MKKYFIVALLLLACACTRRIYLPVESVRMVERVARDTVIEWRLEREYIETHRPDTTSMLNNQYSSTTATWSAGMLHHTLESKDKTVEIPMRYIETNTYDTIRVPYPVKGDSIDVRMPLRWWESFLMVLGGVFIVILGVRWVLRKF